MTAAYAGFVGAAVGFASLTCLAVLLEFGRPSLRECTHRMPHYMVFEATLLQPYSPAYSCTHVINAGGCALAAAAAAAYTGTRA